MRDPEYEKDILLVDEDDDDENGGFDYNEPHRIPKILTEEEIKKLKQS